MRLLHVTCLGFFFALLSFPLWAESQNEEFMEQSPLKLQASSHMLMLTETDALSQESDNSFLHEGRVSLNFKNWDGGVRFTSNLGVNKELSVREALVLEKKFVQASLGNFKFRAGDSHLSVGRGMAVELFEDQIFGQNNTLEGGLVSYEGNFQATAFGGRLRGITVPVTVNPLENPFEKRNFYIVGATIDTPVSSQTKLGLHYVLGLNAPFDRTGMGNGLYDKTWNRVGARFEANSLFEALDLYGETTLSVRQQLFRGKYDFLPTAASSYVSASWANAPYLVKVEGFDYRLDDFEFRRPPTLNLDIIETKNTSDVTAGRLTIERYHLLKKERITGSYQAGYDRGEKAGFHHWVAAYSSPVSSKLSQNSRLGYRLVEGKEDFLHGSVKMKLKTFSKQSLEAQLGKRYTFYKTGTVENRDQNLVDMTYTFSKNINVGISYEWLPNNLETQGNHFVGGNVNYQMGNLVAKAFLGETSGGTKCSGGVCRQVPAFKGGLVEAIYQF